MSNTLFRKKSLERISSPEELNDYIRVSTPSVWLLLLAVVILLLGVCVWGAVGRLDTTLNAVATAQDGVVIAYVHEDDAQAVREGMSVSLGENKGTVASVGAQPVFVSGDIFSEYMRHVGSLQTGEWVYAVELDVSCPDGVYAAQIVIDSVSPMSFVLN